MAEKRGGVILGRFMPPHAGHQYLINFAHRFAGELDVFVCTLAHEPIPGELRYAWIRELFPHVRVVHITEEIPAAARSESGAEAIWARSLRDRMDHDPAYVFASEAYGLELARALDARFVPVDPQRSVFPVSAGMIRENPLSHWEYIPQVVRPYFARRVVIAGGDNVEPRVALAHSLAERYGTVAATDYASFLVSAGFGPPAISDRTAAARAQRASEEALLRSANRVLVTPADPDLLDPQAGERPAPILVVSTTTLPMEYVRRVEAHGGAVIAAADWSDARTKAEHHLDGLLSSHLMEK